LQRMQHEKEVQQMDAQVQAEAVAYVALNFPPIK